MAEGMADIASRIECAYARYRSVTVYQQQAATEQPACATGNN